MEDEVQRFVEQIAVSADAASLSQVFSTAIHAHGMTSFMHALIRQSETCRHSPQLLTTYPPAWIERYRVNRYHRIDPVVRNGAATLFPFAWHDLDATGTAARLMAEAAEFGLISGFTVPIHGPGGAFALVSMASDLPPRQLAATITGGRHRLHLMALYLHGALTARRSLTAPRAAILTPREAETLAWTAKGKTAWEIGEILGISERTAVFHLENAKRKLGVTSKNHAVAEAVRLGLINP